MKYIHLRWYVAGGLMVVLCAVCWTACGPSSTPSQTPTPAPAQSTVEQARSEQRDTFCAQMLLTLQDAAGYYLQEYRFYPTQFLALDEYLGNGMATSLQNNCEEVYYSYHPVTQPNEYHLGVKLESCTFFVRSVVWQAYLKNDADFDSSILGWEDGFNGRDNNANCPDELRVFDVTSDFNFKYSR